MTSSFISSAFDSRRQWIEGWSSVIQSDFMYFTQFLIDRGVLIEPLGGWRLPTEENEMDALMWAGLESMYCDDECAPILTYGLFDICANVYWGMPESKHRKLSPRLRSNPEMVRLLASIQCVMSIKRFVMELKEMDLTDGRCRRAYDRRMGLLDNLPKNVRELMGLYSPITMLALQWENLRANRVVETLEALSLLEFACVVGFRHGGVSRSPTK